MKNPINPITSHKQPEKATFFELFYADNAGNGSLSRTVGTYSKGDHIYVPDSPSDKIYLIQSGRVKIGSISNTGKEIIKTILQEGDIFGELALAGEKKRRDFAQVTEEDTQIVAIELNEVLRKMSASREYHQKITQLMGLRLRRAEQRLESLVFKDARTRIVDYIRDLALRKGKKTGDELLVETFLTHKEIAHITGTSRQTVTTVLNELRDANLIYFDRKRLLVRDIDKLQ